MLYHWFRIGGDLFHVISFVILLKRLWDRRNAFGISLKTQELYLLVFLCRYLDLLNVRFSYLFNGKSIIPLYNSIMKIFYIAASGYIVYLMRFKHPWNLTYEKKHDTFRHVTFAIVPCIVLALIFNQANYSRSFFEIFFEISWAFSQYLEALAILPQLIMVHRHKGVENLTAWYMVTLGLYRALYFVNWVVRYYTTGTYDWLSLIAGTVQTILYCDFFYEFVKAKAKGQKNVILPH